jgi:hypothetical protein
MKKDVSATNSMTEVSFTDLTRAIGGGADCPPIISDPNHGLLGDAQRMVGKNNARVNPNEFGEGKCWVDVNTPVDKDKNGNTIYRWLPLDN